MIYITLKCLNAETGLNLSQEDRFSLDEYLREWADRMYPDAPILDRCAFAGLTAYFVSESYGGFGTENYRKERIVEVKARKLYENLMSSNLNEDQLSKAMFEFVKSQFLWTVRLDSDREYHD